jgi:hypothetical protein
MTSFTKFEAHPPELQRDIWDLTFPGPKCVMVNYYDRVEGPSSSDSNGAKASQPVPSSRGGWHSHATIPIALHVCKSYRTEAQRHYQLAFGGVNDFANACPRI